MITSGFGTTFDLERGTTRRWVMRDGVKHWADDGSLVQQQAAQQGATPLQSYDAQLVLIRGLPGSGKSTMARSMSTHAHYEADMYFTDASGVYRYDAGRIKDAHEWCQRQTFNALANGKSVVVSNTFTRRFEMAPYFKMAKTLGIDIRVIEARGNWPNVHGVPADVVDRMRKRWEKV